MAIVLERSMRRCCGWVVVALAFAGVAASSAHAQPLTISVTALGENPASDLNGQDDPGACTGISAATGCTLRDAIDLADEEPGSTVMLASGEDQIRYRDLQVTAPMTILGGAAGGSVVAAQPGATTGPMLELDLATPGPVTISGVEITGGDNNPAAGAVSAGLPGDGGGILVDPSVSGVSVSLQDASVVDNSAVGTAGGGARAADGQGGGIAVETPGLSTSMTIEGSTIASNFVGGAGTSNPTYGRNGVAGGIAQGGGIYFSSSGELSIAGSTVEFNTAGGGAGQAVRSSGHVAGAGGGAFGGGVYSAGQASLSGVNLRGNASIGGAGGTAVTGATGGAGGGAFGGAIAGAERLIASALSVSGNTATSGPAGTGGTVPSGDPDGYGGGLYLAGGAQITASTISANSAAGSVSGGRGIGGGIDFFADRTANVLVDSTIDGNAVDAGGAGGGIVATAPVTLASDTVDANAAPAGSGADLDALPRGEITATATIVADGTGAAGSDECGAGGGGAIGDLPGYGHNLESDAAGPSQCGFAAPGDLREEPDLGPLAADGGPTYVLLPDPGSPVIGAGGSCVDPTSSPPDAPLVSDQRGDPRPAGGSSCDIGSVQTQAPVNLSPPAVTGTAVAGQTLQCAPGVWSGDGTLAYSYQWLRDGQAIAGATSTSYATASVDAAHTLACQVTVVSGYGEAVAVSGQAGGGDGTLVVAAPPPSVSIVVPAMGAIYAQHRKVRAAFSCADAAGGAGIASCAGTVADGRPIDTRTPGRHTFLVTAVNDGGTRVRQRVSYIVEAPTILSAAGEARRRWHATAGAMAAAVNTGTSFTFKLNVKATVTLTFNQIIAGREIAGRCVAKTNARRAGRRCRLTPGRGSIKLRRGPGRSALAFSGTVTGGRILAPGSYAVTIVARARRRTASRPVTLEFTIIG
jgi:hypothetical protein